MMNFFVNDLLDCAVLNSRDKNFVKSFSLFDIRIAVRQVVLMMDEKVKMLNVPIEIRFVGFVEQLQQNQ